MSYKPFLLTFFLLLGANVLFAQPKSENGWILSTEGTFRVYMVFVEIEYDEEPEKDPKPKGDKDWKIGQLPKYKDEMFNVFDGEDSLRLITNYYDECSFGKLKILGDYYPKLIRLKHSEIGRRKDKIFKQAAEIINSADTISSANLSFEDFDFWLDQKKYGEPKTPSGEFAGIDHVMFFVRNYAPIPGGNGQASGSSAAVFGGKKTDTYSIFGGGDKLPFKILKHEFNHLLIGGNNFHSGGGNSAGFRSYTLALQGGWSMMGAANSSLLSPSAWDRYWLGWKPEGNDHLISASDIEGNEKYADISPEDGTQVFVLRDFIHSGDAIRIKQPFIPEGQYQQWIWIENHTTDKYNGSPTDRYKFEHHDCIEGAIPGLYLARQIAANEKEGSKIYTSVYADYLKSIPANGAYDYQWEKEKVDLGWCVDNRPHWVFSLEDDFENPLTGTHGLEEPFYYTDSTEAITDRNMRRINYRRNRDGTITEHPNQGMPEYAMTKGGVSRIGIGTNPSTATTITYTNRRKKPSTDTRNSSAVYLNGISIEILRVLQDLALEVKVSFDDTLVSEPRRWAGSEIVLNDHNTKGTDLYVQSTLKLDRGETVTKFDQPETVEGKRYFSAPTVLRLNSGSRMTVNGIIEVLKDSKIIVESGAELVMEKGSRINLQGSGQIVVEEGGRVSGKGKFRIPEGTEVVAADKENYKILRKRTCQKKRVRLTPMEAKP